MRFLNSSYVGFSCSPRSRLTPTRLDDFASVPAGDPNPKTYGSMMLPRVAEVNWKVLLHHFIFSQLREPSTSVSVKARGRIRNFLMQPFKAPGTCPPDATKVSLLLSTALGNYARMQSRGLLSSLHCVVETEELTEE